MVGGIGGAFEKTRCLSLFFVVVVAGLLVCERGKIMAEKNLQEVQVCAGAREGAGHGDGVRVRLRKYVVWGCHGGERGKQGIRMDTERDAFAHGGRERERDVNDVARAVRLWRASKWRGSRKRGVNGVTGYGDGRRCM